MSSLRSPRLVRRLLACLSLLWLTSAPLLAHHLPPGMEDVDEFEDGMAFMAGIRHPLLGVDHWFFAVVVGVLAVLWKGRSNKISPLVCLLPAMLGGVISGLQGIVLPEVSWALLTAMMAVMTWSASTFRGQAMTLLGITMLALWQGNQHGIAWPLDAGSGWYVAGLMITTTVLACCGSVVTELAVTPFRLKRPARVTSH
ncbi:HupE/UreJ family protein [Brevifollis gellanilyticus]|nr:HupE/UreJ family protein [Brevifollis gellanilyticus]